jgi:hypothetical protein
MNSGVAVHNHCPKLRIFRLADNRQKTAANTVVLRAFSAPRADSSAVCLGATPSKVRL